MRVMKAAALICGACLFIAATTVYAADYPSRPVRLLVPYAAGGGSDTAARLIADPLGRHLGGSVFIENRGGGGGLIGTEAYLSGEQDGYTILMGAVGPLTIIPAGKSVPYDAEKDFVPLGCVWRSAQVLAVRSSLGVKTVAEFVARAKAEPGKLTVGSAGFGSLTHLALELLKREAHIDVTHVPFRSGGATLPNLIGGQIDAVFADATTLAPQVKSGAVVALAVAGAKRSPALPDVMTMAEAGFPNVRAESWYGLVVSKTTPPEVTRRLQAAVLAAQNDPAYIKSLDKQGVTIGQPGPDSLKELIHEEAEKWKVIVQAAGIKFN